MIYETLYLSLFNAVSDALRALEDGDAVLARNLLIRAQQEAEERFLAAGE